MIDNMAHFFGTNVLAKNRKMSTLKTRKLLQIANYPFRKIFAKFSKHIEKLEYFYTF
jgi:hypothetical protein